MKQTLKIIALLSFLIANPCLKPLLAVEGDTSSVAVQETVIDKWKLSFTLPSNKWHLAESKEDLENKKALLRYEREALIDSNGVSVYPNIGVIFEEVPKKMNAVNYSINIRTQMGSRFGKIITATIHGDSTYPINLQNALVYVCQNKDSENIEHTVIWVHSVNKRIGTKVIMDVTSNLYGSIREEFIAFLKSLKDIE